jgi:asparagine synthase (glutamine-hydrolysing)
MCGIAGWVDFNRDLTRERATAQAMTDTMRLRGPDAEGLWIAPHVALGHRRLAVIDIEGGRQPMIAEGEGGAPVAVLTYSGEVYNFRELRAELRGRGQIFRTSSDTEVVLKAYLEWGEAFVERLNGMYAFALWDTRLNELLLVRDRMGIKPLFYYPTPSGLLFGSEPKAILANPEAKAVLDDDGLRQIMTFVTNPGRVAFRGMREVIPGHTVRVRSEGLRERRYWKLEAAPHPDDLATTVKKTRELLEDIVARQIIADVPLCSLLSGGLDSSTITALATQALRAQGAGPVRSFSLDLVGYAENFQSNEFQVATAADAPYVADVTRHLASEHSNIVLSTAALANPDLRAAVVTARDLPFSLGDIDPSLYLLFREIRKHSTVALSGESSDEVFGGYPWMHNPQSVTREMFPWMVPWFDLVRSFMSASKPGRVFTPLIDPTVLERLELDSYAADLYREALAEVPRLEGEEGLERRMRENLYLHLTRFLPLLLERKDRLSMACGLEVRVPFCDHRLVQYIFNAPWTMKTFDRREKSLLRAAAEDLLPRSVLDRRKHGYPSTQDPAYAQVLLAQFAQVVHDSKSPVLPLLDHHRTRELLEKTGQPIDQLDRELLEAILNLNVWLDRCQVQVKA